MGALRSQSYYLSPSLLYVKTIEFPHSKCLQLVFTCPPLDFQNFHRPCFRLSKFFSQDLTCSKFKAGFFSAKKYLVLLTTYYILFYYYYILFYYKLTGLIEYLPQGLIKLSKEYKVVYDSIKSNQ